MKLKMNRRKFIQKITWGAIAGLLPSTLFAGRTGKSLPRVLLIGDSISIGYTPFVSQMLLGQAEVIHNEGNAQNTGTGLKMIDKWLGNISWDIIHFNWGLWDLAYRSTSSKVYGNRDKVNGTITHSLKEYGQNLKRLVERLQKTSAKLIWANTTPVPPGEAGRISGDARKYNSIAEDIMKKNDIPINDLYSYMINHMDKYQIRYGDVHFTKEGYEFLAKEVVKYIEIEISNLT